MTKNGRPWGGRTQKMRPDRECDSRTVCTEAGRNSFHPHQKRNRRIYTGEDGQMKIVAVVFDMDGVLFDTERIGVQSWTEAAEPTGLQNAYEIARMCIGRTIPGTKEVFMAEAEKQGIVLDFEKLHADCSRRIFERRRGTGCRRSRGYMKSSNIFMRKDSCCIGIFQQKSDGAQSSGEVRDHRLFQKIVTGDMVTHGKPSPDIYLKACEELGAAPEEVIAIEDSFNGIRSASAAGLHPIMVPDQLQPTEEILLLAEAKCDSLLDVKQLLEDKYLK